MKKIFLGLISLTALVTSLSLTPSLVLAAPADDIQTGVNSIGGDEPQCKDAKGNKKQCDLGDQIKAVVNLMLFFLGAVAVIMIVIGGIRYTTSNGDSTQTKAAKDTILYSVVGLVVAIMAYAIVNFVIGAF